MHLTHSQSKLARGTLYSKCKISPAVKHTLYVTHTRPFVMNDSSENRIVNGRWGIYFFKQNQSPVSFQLQIKSLFCIVRCGFLICSRYSFNFWFGYYILRICFMICALPRQRVQHTTQHQKSGLLSLWSSWTQHVLYIHRNSRTRQNVLRFRCSDRAVVVFCFSLTPYPHRVDSLQINPQPFCSITFIIWWETFALVRTDLFQDYNPQVYTNSINKVSLTVGCIVWNFYKNFISWYHCCWQVAGCLRMVRAMGTQRGESITTPVNPAIMVRERIG